MGRLLTTRRAEWFPGVAILAAAVGIGAILGVAADSRYWLVYLAGIVGVLVGVYAVTFQRSRPAAPLPRTPRGPFEVIRGGQPEYDLEKDKSTDSQRWLM
jgi:hypothetical protein